MKPKRSLYGFLAEFAEPESLKQCIRSARHEGFKRMDAFTPFPVEGVSEELGAHRSMIPLLVLIGGVVGGLAGAFMQWYSSVVDYPLNIGGRPFNSWPSFIPVTFELTILIASLFAFFGVLALNRLPMPYHPVFNVERFELASRNRFFLCIEAVDSKFELERTRRFLDEIGSLGTYEVES